MPKNRDHHEVLLVAGTLYRLEKRTGWPYASCTSPWPCGQKKEKRKENEKNTDGEERRRGVRVCVMARLGDRNHAWHGCTMPSGCHRHP